MEVEDGMVFRATNLDDRAGVLDIGDVWEGCDYLPEMFNTFATDPRYRSFVCEADGRIVAFRFYRILSGGKAIFAGGIRTHPDYRGKSIASRLGKFCARELATELGANTLLSTFFTATESALQYDRITSSPDNFTLLTKRRHKYENKIKHLSPSENASTALSEPVRSSFFPDNHVMVVWQLFPVDEDNVRDIFFERSSAWSSNADHQLCWLSTREAFQCSGGLLVHIDMYGVDDSHIADHITDGLAFAMSKHPTFKGPVEVLVYADMKHDLQRYDPPFDWVPGALSDYKVELCIKRRIVAF